VESRGELQEFGALSSAHFNLLGMVRYHPQLAKVTPIQVSSFLVVEEWFGLGRNYRLVEKVAIISDMNRLSTPQVFCGSSHDALNRNDSRDSEILKVYVGKLKVGRDRQRPIAAAAGA
jgi:hypothetical protein